MYLDRMDYLYDKALRTYCELEKKEAAGLSEGDCLEVSRRACAHIGFFFTWLVRRHMLGDLHREESLEAVRLGEMSGTDFFLRYCDGKFREEDVAPAARPFVADYYGEGLYWRDYVDWVLHELCDIPLEFSESYEDYLRLEPVLDRVLEAYQRGELA